MTADLDPEDQHEIGETEEGSSAPSSEIELPELTATQRERLSEEIYEQLQMSRFTSWEGNLPHPNDMREYESIYPGAAHLIIENMAAPNRLMEKAIDNDRISMDQFWQLRNREEDRLERESDSDRKARDRATIGTFAYMFVLLALVFVIVLIDLPSKVQITGILAVTVMLIAPAIINSLRGRHSNNEKALIESVPEMIRASRGSSDNQTQAGKPDPETKPDI